MPSLDDVRRELDKDELDYPVLARELGTGALPELEELVREDEPRIASKAAYLAGLISGATSNRILGLAAQSRHDVIRVSAAAAIQLLPADQVADAANRLLDDPDTGVRVRAAKSVAALDEPVLFERVRGMAEQDADPAVREVAAALAQQLPPR